MKKLELLLLLCYCLDGVKQMTIGQRIKEIRKQRGLTQQEVGKRIGVTASFIGQYENGARFPKFETLKKIAAALNVDVYTLDPTLSGDSLKLDSLPEEVRSLIEKGVDGDLSIAEAVASYWFLDSKTKESIKEQVDRMINHLNAASQEPIELSAQQFEGIRKRLNAAFDLLSPRGKLVAVERVEELAKIPQYQAQQAAEPAKPTPKEKDTPEE